MYALDARVHRPCQREAVSTVRHEACIDADFYEQTNEILTEKTRKEGENRHEKQSYRFKVSLRTSSIQYTARGMTHVRMWWLYSLDCRTRIAARLSIGRIT